MPHEGGETDVLSHVIYYITRQIKRGATVRGRKLEPDEIEQLTQRRERVRQQLRLKTLRNKTTPELRDKLERQGVDPRLMSREQIIDALTQDNKGCTPFSLVVTNAGNHSDNGQQEKWQPEPDKYLLSRPGNRGRVCLTKTTQEWFNEEADKVRNGSVRGGSQSSTSQTTGALRECTTLTSQNEAALDG